MIGYVFVSRGVEFLIDAIQLGLGAQCGLQLHDRLQQRGEQLRLRQEILDALTGDLGADRAGVAEWIDIAACTAATITADLSASLHAAALTTLLSSLLTAGLVAGLLILALTTLAALALTTLLTLLTLLTLALLTRLSLLPGLSLLLTLLPRLSLLSIRAARRCRALLLLLLLQLLSKLLGELLRTRQLLTHPGNRGVGLITLIQRQCLSLQRLHLLHQFCRIARRLLNRVGAGGRIGVVHGLQG